MKSLPNPKWTRGFTFIELLVVITIIGILATITIISYSGAPKRARDAQRKSDLNQYRIALEVYANDNVGLYPERGDIGAIQATLLCSLYDPAYPDRYLSPSVMPSCPEDPKYSSTNPYKYQTDSRGAIGGAPNGTMYVLWANLEVPTTTTYWVICSNGKVGTATSGIPPSTPGTCPL